MSDTYNVTANDVTAIIANGPAIIRAMRASVDKHYGDIMSELDAFDALSPMSRLRHALVFSIVSPKCPIDKNTRVTPVIVDAIMRGANVDDIRGILLEYGIGLQNVKAKRLANAADFMRTCTTADVTRERLAMLDGISFKTSAMCIALYDQSANVYTLDTHMLRWACMVAGLDRQHGTYTISDGRYVALESFLLDIARTHCADAPIFLTQWAIWNDAGFSGKHQVHTHIFGI